MSSRRYSAEIDRTLQYRGDTAFIGAYQAPLDGHVRRFLLPTVIRTDFCSGGIGAGEYFILTYRAPKTLALVPARLWQRYIDEFADELRKCNAYSPRYFQCSFIDSARTISVDKRGRIQIPWELFKLLAPDMKIRAVVVRAHTAWLEIIHADTYKEECHAAQEFLTSHPAPIAAHTHPNQPDEKASSTGDTSPAQP